jgi:hypothetical protein
MYGIGRCLDKMGDIEEGKFAGFLLNGFGREIYEKESIYKHYVGEFKD